MVLTVFLVFIVYQIVQIFNDFMLRELLAESMFVNEFYDLKSCFGFRFSAGR